MEYEIGELFAKDEYFFTEQGFPKVPVISGLENTISKSHIYDGLRQKGRNGRRCVSLGYKRESISNRQRFFRNIWNRQEIKKDIFSEFNKYYFDTYDPKKPNYFELARLAGKIINSLHGEIEGFDGVGEAKRMMAKLERYEKDFKYLEQISLKPEPVRFILVDTEKNLVVPLDCEIAEPLANSEQIKLFYRKYSGDQLSLAMSDIGAIIYKSSAEYLSGIESDIRKAMEERSGFIKEKLEYAFKNKLKNCIEDEFLLDKSDRKPNLRSDYENFRIPFEIRDRYKELLNVYRKYNLEQKFGGMDDDFKEGYLEEIRPEKIGELGTDIVFPEISDHYDLQELFPPTILERYSGRMPSEFPALINFKTMPEEKKFVFAGLHNGSKTFTQNQLTSASLLSQMGLPLIAKVAKLPMYDHIYYFKNESARDAGDFENEIRGITSIIKRAHENDLVMIDEMIRSTTPRIARRYGQRLFDGLSNTGAMLFVIAHTFEDYDYLENNGWIIMSPDAKLEGDKVLPLRTLSRKRPEEMISDAQADQIYERCRVR